MGPSQLDRSDRTVIALARVGYQLATCDQASRPSADALICHRFSFPLRLAPSPQCLNEIEGTAEDCGLRKPQYFYRSQITAERSFISTLDMIRDAPFRSYSSAVVGLRNRPPFPQ